MKNPLFRYPAFAWMMTLSTASGRAHSKMTGRLSRIGMKNSATIGSVRVAASKTRRLTRPHWPPDRCCSISRASDPSVRPRQNRNPISHEWRNWSRFITAPIAPAARPMTPMMSARCWNRASAGESVMTAWVAMFSGASVLGRFVRRGRRLGQLRRVRRPGTSAAAACWLSCSARM